MNAAPRGASPTPLQRSPRLNINTTCRCGTVPASVFGSSPVPGGHHKGTIVQKAFITDQPILQDTCNNIDEVYLCNFSRHGPWNSNRVDQFDYHVLSAKALSDNEDNPSWKNGYEWVILSKIPEGL